MIKLAREAEGHSVRSLSELLKINHTTLSRYESGLLPVPASFIDDLAAALGRPQSYFYREGKRYEGSGNYHRKRASMSLQLLKRIHAKINELRLEAAALLEWADVETESDFFRLNRDDFGGPEGAARELRRLWQMPSGPVAHVTSLIEGAGGIVFNCDFETIALDGVSQWPLDDSSMPPVFFINDCISGDRARFTLCHELGHAVLHHLPTPDLEGEADRFASEFLMPAVEIRDSLRSLTIESAAELKSYWKVSIAALIRRAKDLKVITADRYTSLMKRMSTLGYRKCEPIPIPNETPELYRALFDLQRSEMGRSDEAICATIHVRPDVLSRRFGRGNTGLRLRFA